MLLPPGIGVPLHGVFNKIIRSWRAWISRAPRGAYRSRNSFPLGWSPAVQTRGKAPRLVVLLGSLVQVVDCRQILQCPSCGGVRGRESDHNYLKGKKMFLFGMHLADLIARAEPAEICNHDQSRYKEVAMLKKTLLAAGTAAALSFAGAAQADLIDLFTTDQAPIILTDVGGPIFTQVAGANILGGFRDIGLQVFSDTGSTAARAIVEVDAGTFTFSNDNGIGGQATIQWDGGADAGDPGTLVTTGLGGVDLLAASADRFILDVLTADLGFPFQLRATDMVGGDFTIDLVSAGPGTFEIPFAAFVGVDFSQIGSLSAVINTGGDTLALDLSVASIVTNQVPEPAVLSLLGLGLLGFGITSLRKTKTA